MYQASFPVFAQAPGLIYLDSASTTQKPQVVIDAITAYYAHGAANPDRGLYPLSIKASEHLSRARESIATYLGVTKSGEIIFTSGTTASINVVAYGLRHTLEPGDEIILSELEHHSNILPWLQLSQEKNLKILYLPITRATGEINVGELRNLLTHQTKVVALSSVSNVFGSESPLGLVREILDEAGSGAAFLVDASQSITHNPLSLGKIGADFLVFSSHKIYGPSGVGVLWGRTSSLEKLSPTQSGGGTVNHVAKDAVSWRPLPERLEGGTVNLEGIIGFEAAINWLKSLGIEETTTYVKSLTRKTRAELEQVPGITFISPATSANIISFNLDGIHPHDIAQACADAGICVRAGQHCAGPLHQSLDLSASVRVSMSLSNIPSDGQRLCAVLRELQIAYHA